MRASRFAPLLLLTSVAGAAADGPKVKFGDDVGKARATAKADGKLVLIFFDAAG
jgi:hypothetical protein